MPRLNDHAHSQGVQRLLERFGNLDGQALLNLQSPAEDFDDPRNFAEADDVFIRDVPDVALAEKREQVMFAQTIHVNVPDNDHLVVLNGEQGPVEHVLNVFVIAFGKKLERLGHARRGVLQAAPLGIFPEYRQHLSTQLL